MGEIEDAIEAVAQFPPKRTEEEQWLMLKKLLGEYSGRERLTDAITRSMARRKRVNIEKLKILVSATLGFEYGVWAEECLRTAASRTHITVVDGKDDWDA